MAQFRKEFDRRRDEIARAVKRIAESEAALNIAVAQSAATTERRARWPPRTVSTCWSWWRRTGRSFFGGMAGALRLQGGAGSTRRRCGRRAGRCCAARSCRSGMTLALAAVRAVPAGDRRMYVVGGQRLDEEFLSTLVLPKGMRALLWRDLGRARCRRRLGAADRAGEVLGARRADDGRERRRGGDVSRHSAARIRRPAAGRAAGWKLASAIWCNWRRRCGTSDSRWRRRAF